MREHCGVSESVVLIVDDTVVVEIAVDPMGDFRCAIEAVEVAGVHEEIVIQRDGAIQIDVAVAGELEDEVRGGDRDSVEGGSVVEGHVIGAGEVSQSGRGRCGGAGDAEGGRRRCRGRRDGGASRP